MKYNNVISMLLSVNGLDTFQYLKYKGFFQNISVFFSGKNSSVYMFNTHLIKNIVCVIVTRLIVSTISQFFTRHKIIIRIN